MLKKAYQQEFRTSFTDDASVVEYSGVAIQLIEGDPKNIKITYPEDLALAEVFLKKV
jgi:2-C-methyl-D-erythritol 4-phosphate cytidylyltransferase